MKKLLTVLLVLAMVLSVGVATGLAAGSASTILDGTYTEIYNVVFSADTDTYYSLAHSLGATPDEFYLTAIDANCLVFKNAAGAAVGNTAMPYVNSLATGPDVSSTKIGIAKHSTTESATCAVRVFLRVTHSIIK